jgi:hypothetical protein
MTNFLNKLSQINFTSYSDGKLMSEDGWAVFYSVKLQDNHGLTESLFQVVVRVTYQGAFVSHYGCVTEEETNQFGNWFLLKKQYVESQNSKRESELEKLGKKLFASLG